MYLTVLRLFPSSADKEALWKFLEGIVGPTRVQPGCLGCRLASESEPDTFLYLETWESMADLLRRLQSGDFGKVLEAMESSARAPEFSVYELTNPQGLELIERVRSAGWQGGGGLQPAPERHERRMSSHSKDVPEKDPR